MIIIIDLVWCHGINDFLFEGCFTNCNDFFLHSAIQPASDTDDTILNNDRKFNCSTNVLVNVCNYVEWINFGF